MTQQMNHNTEKEFDKNPNIAMFSDFLESLITKAVEQARAGVLEEVEKFFKAKPPVRTLSTAQTAQLLGVTPKTLCNLKNNGKISGYRVGHRVVYREDEILQLLQSRKQQKGKKEEYAEEDENLSFLLESGYKSLKINNKDRKGK